MHEERLLRKIRNKIFALTITEQVVENGVRAETVVEIEVGTEVETEVEAEIEEVEEA